MAKNDTIENTVEGVIDSVEKSSPIAKWLAYSPQEINQFILKLAGNLVATALILFIGFWIAKMASKAVNRLLVRRNSDAGLITFLTSGTSLVIKVLVLLTAINQLGIQTTSFIAVLGAAGLAISMAFQGTLANFAGGVIILSLKPFKVGDEIEVQGVVGTVKEIMIFHTFLNTGDNKVIIIPNGSISNSSVINYTRADLRRVDLRVKISHGNNVHQFKDTVYRIIAENPDILKKPEPAIDLDELGDGFITFVVKAWTTNGKHSAVKYYLNERIYKEIPEQGMTFPSSSMEVTLKNQLNEAPDK